MDVSGETGRRDPVEGYPWERVPVVAVVAAICAVCGEESRPAAAGGCPQAMPVWKRAALAELVTAGTDIRDFI